MNLPALVGQLGAAIPSGATVPGANSSFGFPLLSLIVWLPLVGALVILMLPNRSENDHGRIKNVALVFTFIPFFLTLIAVYVTVFIDLGVSYSGGFRYEENYNWLGVFGAQYHVGVDGISLPLVLLSTLLFFVATMASLNTKTRVKEYFFLLLVLDIGVTGVFTAMDLLLFFIFWEIELIPMFLLILIWGGKRRVYAAWKFLLYTIAASAALLLAILVLYFKGGAHTFDMTVLSQSHLAPALGGTLFWLFFLCFAIKLPVWPLHTWLPDAHVEAPTAMSVLLAGVLLKMGGYGMIRICVGFFPAAAKYYSLAILTLAVIGILWGGFAALAQDDMKRMVAYSSVSHMGFVLLGISALTPLALNGAVFQLFAHGIVTGSLFLLVGLVYDRAHTRSISELGGLAQRMPYLTVAWVIGALASVGLPGFVGFVAEFEIFLGSYGAHHIGTLLAVFGVVLSAGYLLWMLERVFFGPLKEAWAKLKDPTAIELFYMYGMLAIVFLTGVLPGKLTQLIDYAIAPLTQRLGGS
ncbi:MAG: NADH-quinone oxidoreductase subunit [Chloroflexota bacterium]|jgi:NADH-quinone oxidoreductase subunit M|nr:NADH-quinone oxidoreductase subunit [Chloroflexota bacterium]